MLSADGEIPLQEEEVWQHALMTSASKETFAIITHNCLIMNNRVNLNLFKISILPIMNKHLLS
jgi:hypothetical protein